MSPFSVLMSLPLCRVLPRYLNSVTCGTWADCILSLPNGIPSRHMYSVFALDTFINLPRLPSTAPVPTPARLSPLRKAPHRPRTSSAKVLLFICFPSENPSLWQTGKGRKRILGGGQQSTAAHLTTVSHWWYMFFKVMSTSLTPPCLACTNTVLPSGLCFLHINEHTL